MSFVIATDTSANLPTPYTRQHGIIVTPFTYHIDGQEYSCVDTESFDGDSYFASLKDGPRVTTSQIPPQRYIDNWLPALMAGKDLVFIGMSSGISGSYASAEVAAMQLREQFPDRSIYTIDTLAASLGEGLQVIHAVNWRAAGLTAQETAHLLLSRRENLCQTVLLEDLMFLKRGGRLPGVTAVVGTVLGIRPMLKGSREGTFASCGKVRSRKAGLAALAERYEKLSVEPGEQIVAISYTDCRADAERLAEMLRQIAPPKQILLEQYEPVTGSYLGPGAVALFFEGDKNVRDA